MKKGDRVKLSICQQAIELFATHGYYQTSFQMIADACELKQSNVLYHYKDKHKLFYGVLEIILMSNYQMVATSMTPEMNAHERLLAHLQTNLNWAVKNKKEAQVILLLYYFATFEPIFEEIYIKVLKGGRQRIHDLVLAGVREGFYEEIELEKRSEIIHDMLLASVIPFISRTKKVTKKEKEKTFDKWNEFLSLISC